MRKDKYYVVNSNCADWYTNINKAIKEVKKGYFGTELTYLYTLKNLDDTMRPQDLGYDDLLIEFENCKITKDWRK